MNQIERPIISLPDQQGRIKEELSRRQIYGVTVTSLHKEIVLEDHRNNRAKGTFEQFSTILQKVSDQESLWIECVSASLFWPPPEEQLRYAERVLTVFISHRRWHTGLSIGDLRNGLKHGATAELIWSAANSKAANEWLVQLPDSQWSSLVDRLPLEAKFPDAPTCAM